MLYLLYFFPILSMGVSLWFWNGFRKKVKEASASKKQVVPEASISIVVVLKDEAYRVPSLLDALGKLSLQPKQLIFVDDHSSDNTSDMLQKWTENNFGAIILNTGKGKKQGLLTGISHASSDWILTTDADCIMTENWVQHAQQLIQENCKKEFFILPVRFEQTESWIAGLDKLEAYSLIGSTFGVESKQAFMCNGANLLFKRQVYLDLKVFDTNMAMSTGDDLFALFAFKKKNRNSIGFSLAKDGWVTTGTATSTASFWRQRKRWASKARMYTDNWATLFSWMVFLSASSMIVLLILSVFGKTECLGFVGLVMVKAVVEYLFLKQVTTHFEDKKTMRYFLPTYVLYNFYVLIVAIFGLLHSFKPSREVNGAV